MTHPADDPRRPNAPRPAPLDYPSPGLHSPARRVFALSTFVSALVVTLVVSTLLIFVVPLFEVVFGDFGVTLPLPTVLVLRASRAFTRGWWLVALVVPVFFGFVAPLFDRYEYDPATGAPRRRRGRGGFGMLLTLLLGAIVVLAALALLLPMMQLIQSVSAPGGK